MTFRRSPPSRRRRSLFAAVALIGLAAAGCSNGGTQRSGAAEPDILLILVDTLRADHLSAYGYVRTTSPFIDGLAARGTLFESHRAQAPCTFPSANSLLTSQLPDRFLERIRNEFGIPESIPSIAEILAARGYSTAAVSASPIVRANPGRYNHEGGFGRGFAEFHEDCTWKDASCVNREALALGERLDGDAPAFLYLHYIDPHGPYRPPAGFARRYADSSADAAFPAAVTTGEPSEEARRLDAGQPATVTREEIAHWIDLYDDEIAYLDQRVGELIEAVTRWSPQRPLLVALISDHGESFLEHGSLAHCRTLFESEIRTPLILAGPGIPRGRRVRGPSENLDLVPTLLDFAGIELPAGAFAGRSLRPEIEQGPEVGSQPQVAFRGTAAAVIDGNFKLIFNRSGRWRRLYDLAADPDETTDLSRRNRRTVARLRETFESRHAPGTRAQSSSENDAVQELRALGYL
ncbi:MAG: sulfatase [Thermoanaerobaculia bacterium]